MSRCFWQILLLVSINTFISKDVNTFSPLTENWVVTASTISLVISYSSPLCSWKMPFALPRLDWKSIIIFPNQWTHKMKVYKNPVNIRAFRIVLLKISSPKGESIFKEYTVKNMVSLSFSTLVHLIDSRIQDIIYVPFFFASNPFNVSCSFPLSSPLK